MYPTTHVVHVSGTNFSVQFMKFSKLFSNERSNVMQKRNRKQLKSYIKSLTLSHFFVGLVERQNLNQKIVKFYLFFLFCQLSISPPPHFTAHTTINDSLSFSIIWCSKVQKYSYIFNYFVIRCYKPLYQNYITLIYLTCAFD